MNVIIGVLFGVLALLLVAIMVLVIFVVNLAQYGQKLMLELPWMTWLTFQTVLDMGYEKFRSSIVLSIYAQKGYVETRLKDELSDEERGQAETEGFTPNTINSFEFRLARRGGGRKKQKPTPSTRLVWQPAMA